MIASIMVRPSKFGRYIWVTFAALSVLLPGCRDSLERELLGKDENYVISKLGKPGSSVILKFSRSSNLHEYQSNLYKIFSDIGDSFIEVKELRWKMSDDTVVVWLKKSDSTWAVVDTLKWGKDIRY